MRSKPVNSTPSFLLLLLLSPASCLRVLCDGLISYMVKWTLSFTSYFWSSCLITAIQTPTKTHTNETMKVEMLHIWETANTNFVALYYYSVGYSSESYSCLSFPRLPHASPCCMHAFPFLSAPCMPLLFSNCCMHAFHSVCPMHVPALFHLLYACPSFHLHNRYNNSTRILDLSPE